MGANVKTVLTLAEVADHFGVCTRTLIAVHVKRLGLKAMRFPGGWRFRVEDIEAFEADQARAHVQEAV